jgi:hypothetical protein
MTNTHLPFDATCPECSFTSRDVALLQNHSCDIQANGGRCEDFPCCGHNFGECSFSPTHTGEYWSAWISEREAAGYDIDDPDFYPWED